MTSITIPTNKRVDIGLYCCKHISPQRYYLHSGIGGVGWNVTLGEQGWTVQAPNEHLVIIRLKYGV